MPNAPLHRCPYPGCDVLVARGRCPEHAVTLDRRRGYPEAKRFYDSAQWGRARAQKLRRDPLCQYCAFEGRVTEATAVDHYVPLAQGGHPTDATNLVSTCSPCHGRKTRCEERREPYPRYAPSAQRGPTIA